ncbi:MAG: efflux RND transporter periplasmic adaptor subunit [Gammaproteobacteria bacterium]|nr:efflux RND transporter periplasmic adaptor subunit [Gammaproteobacteria bacterium]
MKFKNSLPRYKPWLVLLLLPLSACQINNSAESNGSIRLSGSIEAREIDLAFQVGGRMQSLSVDEGQLLTAGATVAQLDDSDFQLVLNQAKATANASKAVLNELQAGTREQELLVAEADLQKAQSQVNYNLEEVKRISALIPSKLASMEQLEQTQLQFEIAQATLEQAHHKLKLLIEGPRKEEVQRAKAEYSARQEAVAQAKRQLTYTHLDSPLTGMVTVRSSEEGEVVAPGQPVVRIAELSKPWVRAYLSETDLGRVKLGQEAIVKVDSYPDKRFKGELSFISPVAEFTPKTVETRELRVDLVYRVKVKVDNPDGILKIGMPADIILEPSN